MNGPESAEEAARRFQEPTLAQCVEQIRDRGKVGLPFSRVVLIVSEVAEALSALHAKGRTCGHVQASRITVPAHGPAQLLDTAAADAPAADAPAAGVGGDVVGLASAAYYALCGVLPSYFHTMSSLSDGLPADGPASFPVSPSLYRPELTPEVCDVFTRGLSRRSRDRYTSADEFATALRNSAGPAPAAMSARLPSKRILAAVAALVTLALLITGVWLGHARQSQSPPPVTASAPDQPLSSPASPKAAPEQKPPQIRVAAPAVSPPRAAVAAQPSQTAAAKIPASVAALPAPITPKAADIPSSASRFSRALPLDTRIRRLKPPCARSLRRAAPTCGSTPASLCPSVTCWNTDSVPCRRIVSRSMASLLRPLHLGAGH